MRNLDEDLPLPPLSGFALILGASSGFGEASAITLARSGMDISGVHLDRRATIANVERIVQRVRECGREAWFYNVNAADEAKRAEVLDDVRRRFDERKRDDEVRVLLHSLAFGTLRPLVAPEATDQVNQKQIEMTCDVMAHSLVYWVQDLLGRNLLSNQGRIFAMTSTGSSSVWKGYGAVSAAKSALEAHIRQLAVELGPRGITANAICAGVTDTPALKKIPDSETMKQVAIRKNPAHRLTTPDDVARALCALAQPCTYWLNGNVLCVDGGEAHSG
jgi:enoyl-[acyl-carrier protein] reductase III